ncbi:radical SAM protein [Patescibacteria group bacterium]|nr:radical SAM protein [Patescibacteria group bacterium]
MKILLIQCPVYDIEMPPLGLAYLIAALKRKNFSVEVLDINVDFFHAYQQYKKFWKPENYVYCLPTNFFLQKNELNKIADIYADRVLRTKADIIGFSVQTTSSAFSVHLSSKIKELAPDKIIVFGGPECSREEEPGYFLSRPGKGDYIVLGEGEITLVEMIEKISQGKFSAECKGLVMYDGKSKITTVARDCISNLDDLPIPDFSLFPLNKYLHRNSLPLLTSRGCINRCTFCVDTWYQEKYRNRSCKKIAEEILYLYRNYSLRRMKFNDLLINGNLKLLEEMCDALISTGINDLFWSGNMVVRADMPGDLFRKMYDAGCRTVTFGVESTSIKVLKLMKKIYTFKEIEKNLKHATRHGIQTSTNWIVGFPGETREDLFETMEFIVKNKKYINQASPANRLEIIKGSSLYRNSSGLNIATYPQGKWQYGDNTEIERIHRQNIFNKFLHKIGMLNTTQNTAKAYRKKDVGYFKARKILNSFKKELFLN